LFFIPFYFLTAKPYAKKEEKEGCEEKEEIKYAATFKKSPAAR
jgi:hypothetical protein